MAFNPRPDIYTAFQKELWLTPAHRAELKEKRGFTDQTIDELGFKSAREANIPVIHKFMDDYGTAGCFECGLIDMEKRPAWQFTQSDLIIIPYFEIDNETVYFYKSHKRASLRGAGIRPYSNALYFPSQDPRVILCESEFKAAAMRQLGFRALGLGGINVFAGNNIKALVEFIEAAQVLPSEIYVLFDTEIQDDPSLASYKDHYKRRYAQNIWSYILAKRIGYFFKDDDYRKRVRIQIATLPTSWTDSSGKVDIDSALASGKTTDDLERVLKDACEPEVYRDMLEIPERYKPYINRKMEAAFSLGNAFEDGSMYFVNRTVRRGKIEEKVTVCVSNFKIKILNTVQKGTERYREVQLISRFGEHSAPFMLTSKEMTSLAEFRSRCMFNGDFLWTGTEQDWNAVVTHLFHETDAAMVHALEHCGRDDDRQMWAFGNGILKDSGEFIEAKDGTIWDHDDGYRIRGQDDGFPAPKLCTDPIEPIEVFQKFRDAWGEQGAKAFAYAIACLYSKPIFEKEQSFPILMIHGEKRSGKSTLSDIVMSLFGFPRMSTAASIIDTTPVAIMRCLQYFHSFPFRLDEFRNREKKIEDKMTLFRGLYNRQPGIKGTRAESGLRVVKIHAPVILIGEQAPEDPALESRIIDVELSPQRISIHTQQAVAWLYNHWEKLSFIAYEALKDYKKKAAQLLIDSDEIKKELNNIGGMELDPRTQYHFTIMIAALRCILPDQYLKQTQAELIRSFISKVKDLDRSSALNAFWSDVLTMDEIGLDTRRFFKLKSTNVAIGVIAFNAVHDIWAKHKQQVGRYNNLMSDRTLLKYMESQYYFIDKSLRYNFPKLGRIRALTVDLASPTCPAPLKELFEDAEMASESISQLKVVK